MTIKEKMFHGFIVACLFSVMNWFVINKFITEVSVVKYIFIEITLVLSIKMFKFTKKKLGLL